MKKRIIGLGVIVAGVLIAPNFIGSMIESKYKENLVKVAKNPFVNIVESDFKRSWFSAVATMKVSPSNQTELNKELVVEVIDTISFGPVILNDAGLSFNLATSVVDFIWPKNTASTEINEVFEFIESNLSFTTKLTYGLSYNTHFEFNEFNKSEGDTTLFIGAINGDVNLASDQTVSSDIAWNGFTLTEAELQIDFDGLAMQSKKTIVAGDIYTGNSLFSGTVAAQFPKLTVKAVNDLEVLSFEGLSAEATTSINNNLIDVSSLYHIDTLNAQGEKAENVNLDFTIKNLGAESIKKLNDYLIDLSKSTNAPANQQEIAEIMQMFDELLDSNPEININDFSLSVPEGRIQANLQSSLASDSFTIFNPTSAITALTANTEMSVPSKLLERLGVKPFVDIYVSQGLIVENNATLKTTASFNAGQLEVNGNVLPLF